MSRSMTRLLVLFAWLFGASLPSSALAQQETIRLSATHVFGERIEFRGQLWTGARVSSAKIYFIAEGDSKTNSADATWDGRTQIKFEADPTDGSFRAFSDVVYWFEVGLADGKQVISEKKTLYYEDNRFEWSQRQAQGFRVHWYEGDNEFAQSILDVAQLGLKNVQTMLPLSQKQPIDIYVYASAMEMRATLQTHTRNWVGAHTDPDLGVMVVSLPAGPEQHLEMERQVPHELMHILLYQWLETGYFNLPVWLNEGLASVAELYPNPDYLVLLDSAQVKDRLIGLETLCQSFPRDASNAFLAYAEATSFTRYIYQQYGSTGLQALAEAYKDGMTCDRGVEAALGSTLSQLERGWRGEAFGEAAALKGLANLSPWLLVLVLTLGVPIGLTIANARKRSAASPGP